MRNKPVIPKEYQMTEGVSGFTHGEWTELKRMVDAGYERFWRKRGGKPTSRFKERFSDSYKNTSKEGNDK